MAKPCIDKFVGEVLAGWRYDISGIAPEMRGDYEQHLRDCARCRARQRLHRVADVALIFMASLSALVFLVAFVAVRHFSPSGAFVMQIIAAVGFALSALTWIVVAVTTPLPVMLFGAAKEQARRIHERLPEEIRSRLPENLTSRITE